MIGYEQDYMWCGGQVRFLFPDVLELPQAPALSTDDCIYTIEKNRRVKYMFSQEQCTCT